MWVHTLNPTIVQLGFLQIRWYGLVYLIGFLLGVWWLKRKAKELTKDEVWDLIFYLMVGVLAGSRLFEIFWEPQYYLSNPLNLFKIWQGGMSFHGGFVGIIVACWWYCKKKKLNFWHIADLLSIPAIFALALGRIANFINGELWGRAWDGAWCVNFRNTGGGDVCRHPSTLYAAGKRFLVLAWLYWLSYQKEFTPGFVFWNFVFWEGLGRFLVDFYREDILYWSLSLGQWFSMVMMVIAGWMFWKKYRADWKKILQK